MVTRLIRVVILFVVVAGGGVAKPDDDGKRPVYLEPGCEPIVKVRSASKSDRPTKVLCGATDDHEPFPPGLEPPGETRLPRSLWSQSTPTARSRGRGTETWPFNYDSTEGEYLTVVVPLAE
jgi:hypothetical protein